MRETNRSSSVQVEIVNKSFKKKQAENSHLSMRWLARSLNVSAPMMTRIFKGERKLPPQLVPKIAALLDIDREDQERLLKALLQEKGYTQESMKAQLVEEIEKKERVERAEIPWIRPPAKTFDLFKAWYLIAILDATLLKSYDGTAEFLSRRLKLDLKVVQDAMEELTEAGMLERVDGHLKKSARFLELRSSQSLASIRKLHMDHLEKVKKLLETKISDEDKEKRLVTGITLTGSKDKIAVARIKIAEFMQELTKDLASGEPEEVYHFAVQLYPLT